MHKITLTHEHEDDWSKYIGTKVRIINGGSGALGSNNMIGHLVNQNSIISSGSTFFPNAPRVSIKGIIWGLCSGWVMEVQKRKKIYDIYGNVAITKRK